MSRILKSSWFTAITGCLVYLGVTAALITPGRFAAIHPGKPGILAADDDPSWKFRNPEFDQWVAQIKQEKTSLAMRSEQLQRLATRLAAERQEIYSLTQTVARLQDNFNSEIIRFKSQQMDNVKKQAKLISSMTPDGAVALLNQMTDEQVVQLLFVMKTDIVSAILDTMSKSSPFGAQHAAELTMKLRQVLPVNSTNSVNTASAR